MKKVFFFFFSEAVHADFKKTWKFFKRDEKNPNYEKNLLKAVLKYNAKHI